MEISPASLTDAAVTIGEVGEQTNDITVFPHLAAKRAIDALPGSAIAVALAQADVISDAAVQVVSSRYAGFADLLTTAATSFADKDQEIADRLTALGDLNPTGA